MLAPNQAEKLLSNYQNLNELIFKAMQNTHSKPSHPVIEAMQEFLGNKQSGLAKEDFGYNKTALGLLVIRALTAREILQQNIKISDTALHNEIVANTNLTRMQKTALKKNGDDVLITYPEQNITKEDIEMACQSYKLTA